MASEAREQEVDGHRSACGNGARGLLHGRGTGPRPEAEGAKVSPLTAALVRAVVWVLKSRCVRPPDPMTCRCEACTLRREVEKEAM